MCSAVRNAAARASGAIDPQGDTRLRARFGGVATTLGAQMRPARPALPARPEPHPAADPAARPTLVGVVNVTPDSFSDGGRFLAPRDACAHVDQLLADGADVVEVGGESTRPAGAAYGEGYAPVPASTQIDRIVPVVAHAAGARRALVAVDTTLAEVAEAALDAGAVLVNDVSLGADPALAEVVARRGAWLVLMHARPGASSTYADVLADVAREWSAARDRAVAAGVDPTRIVFDPGIGFGKGLDDNLRLLAGLSHFTALGHPIYVGASRKSFIGGVDARALGAVSAAGDRLGGTIAACLHAVRAGAVALRVHDVRAVRQALDGARAIAAAGASAPAAPAFPAIPARAKGGG
ncbi:MAG: hypothetical protein NVS3B10_25460 [Polyangiales bacterium]